MDLREKKNAELKTRIGVMQKEFGITAEGLAEVLKPLIPQVLREITTKKGIHKSKSCSVAVEPTPVDIIKEYLD